MFVILTSRPGQYRTELGDGLTACEAYDYLFYGQKKAQFVIAEQTGNAKIRIVDEMPPALVNEVPPKFLPQFATLEQARAELHAMVTFGSMDIALKKQP
ncbi:MAG: ferredoxin [Acetobacteraceae bacterium]|nr:ferredoxin [Acetobacteraceae bacterium]